MVGNNKRDQGKKQVILSDLTAFGKVPPQSVELEEAVLGACMLERESFELVTAILKTECFYMDAHQKIFKDRKSVV